MNCVLCKKEIDNPRPSQKFCNKECQGHFNRKVQRPTKEELQKLVWEKPATAIADEFGVSDVAVRKWCTRYGINKPPRGYWAKKYSDENKYKTAHGTPPKELPADYIPSQFRMFTDEQVRHIRNSPVSARRLSAELRCHHATIDDIRNYKYYKDVV